MLSSPSSGAPTSPPPKRLRRPRATQACAFCRKRKVRCSGTKPCKYCQEVGVRCEFANVIERRRTAQSPSSEHASPETGDVLEQSQIPPASSILTTPRESRRTSPEPQTFVDGHHLDRAAGVSFLYSALNRIVDADVPPGPLNTYGDFTQPPVSGDILEWMPTSEQLGLLLNRYFSFATPTYRYMHRPSLERWADQFLAQAETLPIPKRACVLLVCAQSLLYTTNGDQYVEGGDSDVNRSRALFEKAKAMLDHEMGPVTLASVQARLAACFYLLSTFRMTECRFCFGLTATILTSLGLHRRDSPHNDLTLLQLECRRRTFWCAYVLDGYLSVMLGRPRILRDEDIDQPYPRNFDDDDLMSSEPPSTIPCHGHLEAFIAHADLAKLMARNNDSLYPVQQLNHEQVLSRTNTMVEALEQWQQSLPEFLKPRDKTLAGKRTFERQNTVLKLAYAHICILATRRCLGNEFYSQKSIQDRNDSVNARACCMKGISTIVNASYDLLENRSLYQAFWYTQYISIVAISTLYVLLIQSSSNAAARRELLAEGTVQTLFEKAQQCHQRLADIAPEGSQASRHYKLLNQLRMRCQKVLNKIKNGFAKPMADTASHLPDMEQFVRGPDVTIRSDFANQLAQQQPLELENVILNVNAFTNVNSSVDASEQLIATPFASSDDGFSFDYLLGWEWESLDTIGLLPTCTVTADDFQL